jgi:molybdopterin-guanine dinucleotide biosynthesis protein A
MLISVVVLCGGRSERMGRDKARLPFGDESMLARVAARASLVSDDVILVGRSALPAAGQHRCLADPGEGPLVALASALQTARQTHVLLLACDMPLVSPELLRHLGTVAGDADACVPRVAGVAVPTCAVYRRDVIGVAEPLVARGARSLRALIDVVSVRWVEERELRTVDPDLISFIDCDTPGDYARALALAGVADRRD